MPLTVPQLDDRNYEQLLDEARARIPVHTPEWTNFNDSDPGITLVQLFAFMTENLLYRGNRIPEANRRKFLTLLGIGLQPASPGRGLVAFRNERGPLLPWPLDAGTEVRAGKVPFRTRTALCVLPVTVAAFYKQPRTDLDAATVRKYQLVYATFLDRPTDQLQFYQTTRLEAPELGKPPAAVDLAGETIDRALWLALLAPQGAALDAVRAAIAGQTLALGVYPSERCAGRVLPPATADARRSAGDDPGLVFEIAAPDPTTPPDQLSPATYARLTVEYAENVLETPGIVQLALPEYDRLRLWNFDPEEEGTGDYPPRVEDTDLAARIVTWIRIRLRADDGAAGPNGASPAAAGAVGGAANRRLTQLSWVGANAARVIQALPVTREPLGVGTGAPDQSFTIANTPAIVELTPGPTPGAPPTSNVILEVQNDAGAWETWRLTDDLFAARANDPVYTLDPESGRVSFGSGMRGRRPPAGRNIRISYEYGGGPAGQAAIGAISKSAALPGGFKVENPVATWGAAAGEDVASGERNIARYLKHQDRLVTASDFRELTLRTPGVAVGRAEALPLFNPERFNPSEAAQTWPGTVTVLVIPKYDAAHPDTPEPNRLFLDAVCTWLDPRRLVTTELYVRGPEYVPLWVTVGIALLSGQRREFIQRDVQEALREYLSALAGGPPVAVMPDDQCPDPLIGTTDPCPTPRGVGWPLGVNVRRQDLEAVATRVPGVRYVESIRLATRTGDGTVLADVEQVAIAGLQLPRLAGIGVNIGPADDPTALLGQQPVATAPNLVAVPVLPRKC